MKVLLEPYRMYCEAEETITTSTTNKEGKDVKN